MFFLATYNVLRKGRRLGQREKKAKKKLGTIVVLLQGSTKKNLFGSICRCYPFPSAELADWLVHGGLVS